MFWLLVGIGLFGFIYVMLIKPFQYWENKEVPQHSVGRILLESLLVLIPIRPMPITIQWLYNSFPDKRYIGSYQFTLPALLLRDPELIKQITVKDFDYFVDHQDIMLSKDVEAIWKKNLFMLKGEQWRDMRITLNSSFTSIKLKTMFGVISDSAKQFVKYFEEQSSDLVELEIKETFERLTNDVIATTAFGISCNSMKNPNNTFYLMAKNIIKLTNFKTTLKLILFLLSPNAFKMLGLQILDRKTTEFFKKIIKENISAREKDGIVRPDMINLLLKARNSKIQIHYPSDDSPDSLYTEVPNLDKNKKRPLTDDDIMAQAMLFFIAGFDPISMILSFMAYELAVNPDVQEKLFREIQEVLQNGELTYEDLAKMKYLDMVVSETLRKYPTAFAFDRVCVKPYTIQATREDEKPIHFKIGDVIWLPVYAIQRDPKYFPQPDRFNPERFNDENKHNLTPYTFLSFGSGPRHCIGIRFAIMEIKLAFFYLLASFEVVVVDKTPIPMKFVRSALRMAAEGGYWVGLKKRKANFKTKN